MNAATTFVSKIQAAGFHLALRGDALEVSPASRLTAPQRQFIREHKAEILAALKAANDSAPTETTDLSTYEVVHFDEFRLSDGRRVSFDLAIPRDRYDAFDLLRFLETLEDQNNDRANH
jgi:hypothetical protein